MPPTDAFVRVFLSHISETHTHTQPHNHMHKLCVPYAACGDVAMDVSGELFHHLLRICWGFPALFDAAFVTFGPKALAAVESVWHFLYVSPKRVWLPSLNIIIT